MSKREDFFIGWNAETPRVDRRFMLGASLALIAGGGAMGGTLAADRPPVGAGVWEQGEARSLNGLLSLAPYPSLRTIDLDGAPRTVFLATSGKTAPRIAASLANRMVRIDGTLIQRGRQAMMAVDELRPSAAAHNLADLTPPVAVDRGPVLLVGEILDAKCWFGAMRPGYGKTHKACAALCARGGLPLAFCQLGACGDGAEAPLLLDQDGRAFGRAVLPLVADPVVLRGRMLEAGDVMQARASLNDIRRL